MTTTRIAIPDKVKSAIAQYAQKVHTEMTDWTCDMALDILEDEMTPEQAPLLELNNEDNLLDQIELDIMRELREALNETLIERFGR